MKQLTKNILQNDKSTLLHIVIGKNGYFTSVGVETTETNSIPYGSGIISNIKGEDLTYNSPIVIVKYRYKLILDGYLNYVNNNWITTDVNSLLGLDLTPYRLVNHIYTKLEVDTMNINTFNTLSTIFNNIPVVNLTPY